MYSERRYSLDLFISWKSTANIEVERATRADEPEMARRASTGIDTGNMLLQSWVLQAGGEMVSTAGTEGQARVPAEKLDELSDLLERYEQTTDSRISVGVGFETHEAATALQVAEARGGKPSVVLYSEGVAQEAHELEESSGDDDDLGPIAPEDEALLDDDAPETDGGAQPTLQKAEGDAKAGEATKVVQGSKDPQAAQPSAPSPVSPMSASPAGAPAAAPGQPQDPQQLKQAIVTVLQDVKKNMASIQQLQQSDPAAFQSVVGLVQAFIAVAQQAFGGQPLQKAEDTFHEQVAEESSEHPTLPQEDVEQIVHDHQRLGKDENPMNAPGPMKPGVRHVLKEPVGTQIDTGAQGTRNAGKVKVRRQDGKTAYVSVRAGQILSQSGHAISSRNPEGK